MAFSVSDYLIDQNGIDWNDVLAPWAWLLPPEFTLWMVNRFADLFLVLPDGTVHMLDVGAGTMSQLAASREDFITKLDEGNNANQWLMIALIDKLVAAGVLLGPGQCYGFKKPPVIGGDYTVENVGALALRDYLGAYGSLHEQLKDMPDGTSAVLRVINLPNKPGTAADQPRD